MQNSRDSSVVLGLATALGDGLAFVAGVKLAQAAARRNSETESAAPSAGKAIEAALSARIDAGFDTLRGEIAATQRDFAQTLGGLLAEQVEIQVRERMGEDFGRLRGEIATLHREFADALARIVTEQIERRIVEESTALRREIVSVNEGFSEAMTAFLKQQVEAEVSERVATAVADAVRVETAGIREQTASAQTAMVDFISAVGAACQNAAGKAAPNPPREDPPAAGGGAVETPAGPRGPQFAQLRRTGDLLRIPLVSSFVLAVGGVLLAHYL